MGIYVPWLADAARATGYPVVEISGWRSRGHGPMRVVEGVIGHHTATPNTASGDYPSLNVVTNGRAGLPGPLANYGLGRNGTIYVIAAGLAYHAGASTWAGYVDLNDEFLGIEAESAGDGRWTADQIDCYPRLVASVLRYIRRHADRYVSHRGCAVPSGRKPDPTGISDDWMRGVAQPYVTGGIPPRNPDPPKEPEDPNVKNLIIGKNQHGPDIWVGDGIQRRHVADEGELEGLRYWIRLQGGDDTVHDFADLRVLGVPVVTPQEGTA